MYILQEPCAHQTGDAVARIETQAQSSGILGNSSTLTIASSDERNSLVDSLWRNTSKVYRILMIDKIV